MMTVANTVFTLGLVSFLTGLGLVDFRAAMVVGGAAAMWFAWKLANLTNARAESPNELE